MVKIVLARRPMAEELLRASFSYLLSLKIFLETKEKCTNSDRYRKHSFNYI